MHHCQAKMPASQGDSLYPIRLFVPYSLVVFFQAQAPATVRGYNQQNYAPKYQRRATVPLAIGM